MRAPAFRKRSLSAGVVQKTGCRPERREIVARRNGLEEVPELLPLPRAARIRIFEQLVKVTFKDVHAYFFRGFADLNEAGPIDLAAVAALAADYGLPYADPDWLPDIIARYNLTPPPPRPASRQG